jgi:hypothetical protein
MHHGRSCLVRRPSDIGLAQVTCISNAGGRLPSMRERYQVARIVVGILYDRQPHRRAFRPRRGSTTGTVFDGYRLTRNSGASVGFCSSPTAAVWSKPRRIAKTTQCCGSSAAARPRSDHGRFRRRPCRANLQYCRVPLLLRPQSNPHTRRRAGQTHSRCWNASSWCHDIDLGRAPSGLTRTLARTPEQLRQL